jgi:conjugative relaxase-like TrwC/TraI family protein
MGGGKEWYYTTLAREDYYSGKELSTLEPEGRWIGKGADRIGLAGETIDAQTFKNLFRGYSPDGGTEWVANAGRFEKGNKRNRMPGVDCTAGMPKSVSIAWALGSEETRAAIEGAARKAIDTTVSKIEERCIVRSGSGGRVKEPAGLIAGVWQHATARQVDTQTPPDMHLHYHITIINTAVTARGKTGAIQGQNILNKDFAKEMGAIFRAEAAKELAQAGFEIERTKEAFELRGVAKEAIDYFSKRTAQIETLAPKETHTYREQKSINIKKRVAKTEHRPAELERHWKTECFKFGLTPAVIESLRKKDVTKSEAEKGAAARYAVKEGARELSAEQVTFTEKELTARTLHTAVEWGLGVKEVTDAVKDFAQSPDVAKTDKKEGQQISLVKNAEEVQEKERREKDLSSRECEGVRTMKRELEAQGYRVIGCAFNAADAEAMTKSGVKSYTVSQLLRDAEWKAKEWERMHTRPNRTIGEIITFQNNFTPAGRKLYAEYKYATGQWSEKAKLKYSGEYWKPSSKLYHEVLYATRQISAKHRDYLNRELERQERKIDGKTIVYLNGSERLKENPTVKKLIAVVEKQGGRVVIAPACAVVKEEERRGEVIFKRGAEPEQRREQGQERVRERVRGG